MTETIRVRFHGGPYDGRVQDMEPRWTVDVALPTPATTGFSERDAATPSPQVTFRTLRYQLVRYKDGTWHAHTPRGMKALRRSQERQQTLGATLARLQGAIADRNWSVAHHATVELENRLLR